MLDLYACVADHHNPALVGVAAVICSLGAVTTLALRRQASRPAAARHRALWCFAGVLAASSSIWSTHFISMLAFRPGVPFGFALGLTILSFLLAFGLVGSGELILMRARGSVGRLAGGAVIGVAISAMHYTGMAAFEAGGHLQWNPAGVAVSVLSGLVLSALSAVAAVSARAPVRVLAPVLLVVAVCADHFVGMTAMTIVADPRYAVPPGAADTAILSILVCNAALVITGLSLAALLLARRDRLGTAAEQGRLRSLADIAVEGLIICDGDTIVSVNRSLERILGRTLADLVGQPLSVILPRTAATDIPGDTERDAELHGIAAGPIPVRVISQPIVYEARAHTVIAIRDQRDRLSGEAEMRRLANHDPLTGLPNRLMFNTSLAERCGPRRSGQRDVALLALDLDGFKSINDMHGHAMGDAVLRRVADRLRRAIGEDTLVARIGGDEFAVLMGGAGDIDHVRRLADRLLDVLSRPLIIEEQVIDLGASIGIALAPADAQTPEALTRNADLALYRAKEDGRGVYRMFEPGMNARMQSRRKLEQALRRAIAGHEFEVHYQPQVGALSGLHTGAEALVRWRDPERGMVPPGEFIPLAEETGLIGAIGEWVLRTACAEATHWPEPLTVAVNLSPVQFRDQRLVQVVVGILADTGLPASRLELEITETVLLNDSGHVLDTLTELRRIGVCVSLDDFGTGYSSLSYLRKFPFDKIKIDRSFIAQLTRDKDSAAIVRAMVALGNNLGMTTTAEGVETAEQLEVLVGEGCDRIQGFFFGRPVPAAEIGRMFTPPPAVGAAA